ncbi:hypothetical protein FRE64_11575 [Euhalothece natronophila Z-M001]|uniref:Uncharacterized protein n=1 Tax=Euhalothece natronophila Z-M001 TaxID=522448 RepID=A0A5B8NNM5_9CHRO|nr:hypothetical protein [Euhalothece natronophila]QDZ40536.1 hypothetical protein FRE64_11575 [Euhalothece natronophila Z-M001]
MERNNLSLIMSTDPNQDSKENQKKEMNQEENEGVKLPDPDMENVTVLTDNLPNNPILPWHHYDSPWEEEETESEDDNQEE